MSKLKLFIILISLIVSGCERNEGNEKNKSNFSESFWIEDYVSNLNFPWSFTWLPNGDLLITERLGKIKLIRNGKFINYIKNVPNVMSSSPFDGLLDITIDPDFLNNSLIYLSYTKGTTTNRIGVVYRAKLENNSLINGKEIYNTSPPAPTGGPNITKLQFLKDKSLVFAVGSSGQHAYNMVQRLDGDIGKIIRINTDGSIPKDNPDSLLINSYGVPIHNNSELKTKTLEILNNEWNSSDCAEGVRIGVRQFLNKRIGYKPLVFVHIL